MAAMLGWFSDASTWLSRVKRAIRSGSSANASGRILMATSRLSLVSVARQTSPMPPSPSLAVLRYWAIDSRGLIARPKESYHFDGGFGATAALLGGCPGDRPPSVDDMWGLLPLRKLMVAASVINGRQRRFTCSQRRTSAPRFDG